VVAGLSGNAALMSEAWHCVLDLPAFYDGQKVMRMTRRVPYFVKK
jgi:hypothetical protein